MKTSSFFTFKGDGRISIARFAPRNVPAGYHTFKKLAPGDWFNSVSTSRYIELYEREILAKLNPEQTWNELHLLAVNQCFYAGKNLGNFVTDSWLPGGFGVSWGSQLKNTIPALHLRWICSKASPGKPGFYLKMKFIFKMLSHALCRSELSSFPFTKKECLL